MLRANRLLASSAVVREAAFIAAAAAMQQTSALSRRRFLALYGVSPRVCVVVYTIWQREQHMNTYNLEIKHLLWGLMFLKVYGTEETHRVLAGGVSERTFRLWSWRVVEVLARMDVVREMHCLCFTYI